MKKLIYLFIAVVIFTSCEEEPAFELVNFDPFSNYSSQSDTLSLPVNSRNAVVEGVAIPSRGAEPFVAQFTIKSQEQKPQRLYYKLYYQNESYKHAESSDEDGVHYNEISSQNFYGSWVGAESGFHKVESKPDEEGKVTISDTLRILGNPRNEEKYFGAAMKNRFISEEELNAVIENIRSNEEWLKAVNEKAVNNQVPLEKQLEMDAHWVIKDASKKGNVNNRWKRNPRMGNYEFMLVIMDETAYRELPYFIKDLNLKDTTKGVFINPFYYFNSTAAKGKNIGVYNSRKVLKTMTRLSASDGLFVDRMRFDPSKVSEEQAAGMCGYSDELFRNAQFEEFLPAINYNYQLDNLPIAADVTGGYTQEDYHKNVEKYGGKRIQEYVTTADEVCESAFYDPTTDAIAIRNIGYQRDTVYQKMNAGINGRIGFTYGKFRAKIKFPETMSEDDVWNGLTCAFWLKFQEQAEWNHRTGCSSGFLPKTDEDGTTPRTQTNYYSEIDIEIVKSSKHWPQSSYGGVEDYPKDDALNDNLIVACTNWDLACADVENFVVGVEKIEAFDKEFMAHRWAENYKAITEKTENPHDETVGGVFYYEIDWQPERIVWRVGTSEDDMRVLGYMDSSMTSIPNNQMVPVVTQEFHDASWWPTAPFSQNNIPFPFSDIEGLVYEITVN
ncbi:hypothetical protein [Halocola ammonii]